MIVPSLSSITKSRQAYLTDLGSLTLYGSVGAERLLGSAAAELCYVAAGRAEGRIEGLLGPWDVAAGTLILSEAGGTTTDFTGGDTYLNGREVLASNTLIHEQLMKVVSNALAQ